MLIITRIIRSLRGKVTLTVLTAGVELVARSARADVRTNSVLARVLTQLMGTFVDICGKCLRYRPMITIVMYGLKVPTPLSLGATPGH